MLYVCKIRCDVRFRGGTPAFLVSNSRRCPERGASRPVSRVLYGARFRARDGHSSGTAVAGRLEQPTRATIRRRIQGFLNRETPCVAPIRSCSRWGLPCRSCCHARGALLPHRFTLALRRFVFCGAFPGVAPAGSYPAPCLRGARTFLRCESGGHPAGWPEPHRRPGPFRQLSNWQRARGTNAARR